MHLRGILAPGGLLVAAEPEPNPLWDTRIRRYLEVSGATREPGVTGSPLRSGEEWRRELALAGFHRSRQCGCRDGALAERRVQGDARRLKRRRPPRRRTEASR